MDVAGARALAERIAQGKPSDEGNTAPAPVREAPRAAEADDGVEVVFVHPRLLDGPPEVWTYVRGPDGHLRRAR
jgi:hypothetical protein